MMSGGSRRGHAPFEYASSLHVVARNLRSIGDVWVNRHLLRPPRYLPIVLAFVTYRCNLRCQMCGVEDHAGEQGPELSTLEWKEAIDSMARLKTMIISFSGGESLLRPDMFELIRHARRRRIAVHLCTNGTRIDRETAIALREAGTHTVSTSIESPRAEVHDLLRGQGTFERTLRGIEALRTHAPGIRIGLNYLVSTQTYTGMVEMLRLAEEIGAHQVKFAPIHTNLLHKDKPLETFSHLIFQAPEEINALEAEVGRLIEAARTSRVQINATRYLRGMTDLYRAPRRFRCYAGYAVCAIGPRGEVSPCCDFRQTFSVRERPLHEIWRSDEFHRLRLQVDRCRSTCWDTTNTELSLRLSARALPAEIADTWRALKFYFEKGRT